MNQRHRIFTAISRTCWSRALVVVGGLAAIQFILFGSSLLGHWILLPLDVLTQPSCYLTPAQCAAWGPPTDPILSDPVLEFELERRFAVSEVRAGRFPLWDPHEYCGAPFLAANWSCVFSPFRMLDYLWPGPWVIAWDQMLKTLVSGIGAYLFCRRVLEVSFFPAAVGAWIWSINGYYIWWAGSPESATATWLPWLFWLTDSALREPHRLWGIGLAGVIAAMLISGHAETAGQELMADGAYFCWRAVDVYGWRNLGSRRGAVAIASVVGGWSLGILLSAPQSLPTLEYLHNSHRVISRLTGMAGSETPPMGVLALPQLFIPSFNGATHWPAYYTGASGNLNESAATGYVGLISALVLAPLAFVDDRRRRFAIFFAVLGLLGMGQVLGLPPIRQIYDAFPLNLMRENRLVFFTGWSLAMLMVMGLDSLAKMRIRWRKWIWIFASLPAALGIWCAARCLSLPDHWREYLSQFPDSAGATLKWFHSVYLWGLALCAISLAAWIGIALGLHRRSWFAPALALAALVEVICVVNGVYPQGDPQLYYPRQDMLQYLAHAPSGRVCAVHCLPACLTEVSWLKDVRGYDGIDPARLVDLLAQTQPALLHNADDQGGILQGYFPRQFPSPITRMINLRYLIFPGLPPPGRHPKFATDGYWLYENAKSLPRVFVPRRVREVDDPLLCLHLLSDPTFDPEDVAYVESPVAAPAGPAVGSAVITSELPSHVTIQFDMQTPGMIFLSDLWYPGWKARVNGKDEPILKANHAFRGVMAPAGKGILQFDFEPESFKTGIWICAAAAMAIILWAGIAIPRKKLSPS